MKLQLPIYAICMAMLASTAEGTEYTLMTGSDLPAPINTTKVIEVNEENYPTASHTAYFPVFVFGGEQNFNADLDYYGSDAPLGGDYTGDTVVNVTGGSVTGVIGGNYGNQEGANFTGNTTINISYDAATYVMGASWLGHNAESTFKGNTQINITVTEAIDSTANSDWMGSPAGAITGGFMGGVVDGTTDETDRFNVLDGNTNVDIDLGGGVTFQSADITKDVTGGSYVVGGVDTYTTGTTSVTIRNPRELYEAGSGLYATTFTSTVIAGDQLASAFPSMDFGHVHSGTNVSNSYVHATSLTIEGGIFLNNVVGGSATYGGGDITVGSSNVNITGGSFSNVLVGGSMMGFYSSGGIEIDTTAGKVDHGDVTMNVSGAFVSGSLFGGIAISGGMTQYESDEDSRVGNITLTLGGWDEDGNALGGTYNGLVVGGSRNGADQASAPITVHQGDVAINAHNGTLKTGKMMVAAGTMLQYGTINATSTSVTIGDEFVFEKSTAVYGGFERNDHYANGTMSGDKLLSFDGTNYDFESSSTVWNKQDAVTFYDFDEVHVALADTHVDAEGLTTLLTLDAEHLTKSGAGTFEVEAGYGDGNVHVTGGTLQINTLRTTEEGYTTGSLRAGTVNTVTIESGATTRTDTLTVDRNAVVVADSGVGLVAKDIKGSGTIHANTSITVNQEWIEKGLDAIAEESFIMTTGANVYLESLTTKTLEMDDSSHLGVVDILDVATVKIDEYVATSGASSPYITAADMVSTSTDNLFVFDFTLDTIENMVLETSTPYLVADLSLAALATADDKSFIFKIDGVGDTFTQDINGTTYYLGTINEDVYIYKYGETIGIPEPSTTTLSLLALAGLLARRRRQRV